MKKRNKFNSYHGNHTPFSEASLAPGRQDPDCVEAPDWNWTCEGPIHDLRGSPALRCRRSLTDSRSSLHSVNTKGKGNYKKRNYKIQ